MALSHVIKNYFIKLVRPSWPHPDYKVDTEPHFLFILTPPYSGSTMLAHVLNSAQGTAFLTRNAEGQWLVRGLSTADRWERQKVIDFQSVRAVWLQRVQLIQDLVQHVDLIIEKSPPNLVRIDRLIEIFPNHSLLVYNRDPYAHCSSVLYREYPLQNQHKNKRSQIISSLAKDWMMRSNWLKKWIDKWQPMFFTYEAFCAEPATCVARLSETIPLLQTIDINKKIKIKDYQKQGIINMNDVQISRLSQEDMNIISNVLAEDPALLSFFGYHIR